MTWFTREDKPLLASRTHPEGIPNGERTQNSSIGGAWILSF